MLSQPQIEALRDIVHYLNFHEFQQASHRNAQIHPLYVTANKVKASYFNYKITSRFQPIRNIRTGKAVAHEALLVVKPLYGEDPTLSPLSVFNIPFDQAGITYIDRLARTVNTLNFLAQDGQTQLHLNVHPLHLSAVTGDHGKVFEGILRQCGVEPYRITLEIQSDAAPDKQVLRNAIQAWQSKGYKISFDNVRTDANTVQSLIHYRPDVIKLDRSCLLHADQFPKAFTHLQESVDAAHAHGIDMIATGVETAGQLDLVRQLAIDKVQGYLLGRPAGYLEGGAQDGGHPDAGEDADERRAFDLSTKNALSVKTSLQINCAAVTMMVHDYYEGQERLSREK